MSCPVDPLDPHPTAASAAATPGASKMRHPTGARTRAPRGRDAGEGPGQPTSPQTRPLLPEGGERRARGTGGLRTADGLR